MDGVPRPHALHSRSALHGGVPSHDAPAALIAMAAHVRSAVFLHATPTSVYAPHLGVRYLACVEEVMARISRRSASIVRRIFTVTGTRVGAHEALLHASHHRGNDRVARCRRAGVVEKATPTSSWQPIVIADAAGQPGVRKPLNPHGDSVCASTSCGPRRQLTPARLASTISTGSSGPAPLVHYPCMTMYAVRSPFRRIRTQTFSRHSPTAAAHGDQPAARLNGEVRATDLLLQTAGGSAHTV